MFSPFDCFIPRDFWIIWLFNFFDCERIWWKLFQKRAVSSKEYEDFDDFY